MSRFSKVTAAALAAAVWGLGSSSSLANPPMPTDDDMKALVDSHRYAEAKPLLQRVLAAKGEVVKDNDRFEDLLMMDECLLQMGKQYAIPLKRSLLETVAEAEDEHDLNKMGRIALLDLMIAESKAGKYTPKSGAAGQKFDLMVPADREAAAPALYADEFTSVREEWRNAKAKHSVALVKHLAQRFAEVRALENKTTGGTAATDRLAKEISPFTGEMIAKMLNEEDAKIAKMDKDANVIVVHQVMNAHGAGFHGVKGPAGLSDQNAADLRKQAKACNALDGDIKQIDAGLAEPLLIGNNVPSALDVAEHAQQVLHEFHDD